MTKNLLSLLGLMLFSGANAQDYVTLQVSAGFNADVIANGVGPSLLSTNSTFDNAGYALISADFQTFAGDVTHPNALPVGGTISAPTPGMAFQLAPYHADNSLRLQEESDFGSLAIANGVPATTLYVLASAGSGTASLGGTIHFSDHSTQAIDPAVVPDWFYSNALPVVLSGFGRVNTQTDVVENPDSDPRLYQFQIAIWPENQTKTITAIDFTKISPQEGVANIFAISAKPLGTCPAPTALTAFNITNTGAQISWAEPVVVPNFGFAYHITTSSTPPADGAEPDGYLSTGVTMLSLDALSVGQTYCVWIRSVCSGSELGPLSDPVCFTTGQVQAIHPDDIPTLFAPFVDVTATTTCPGVMTVNVPSGYVIASVATAYDMQTAANGWMSEQNSILVCNTTGQMESAVSSGVGSMNGTYSYSRSGLDIANGATGTVEFELRAWRTYGGADCNTDYNRVVAGTWTVAVTLSEVLRTKEFSRQSATLFPNPADDAIRIVCDDAITRVSIYNLLGQKVQDHPVSPATNIQVDTSGLAGGKYLVKISSVNGTQTQPLLVR